MPKKGERKTHCKHGHEYTTENTYRFTGGRGCKACRSRRSSVWASANKPMMARRTQRWRDKNPDKLKMGNRQQALRKYGITPVEYERLLQSQDAVCAVCASACPTGKRLSVDHDHVSGAVRGLLCASCNNGIGRFRDDSTLLRQAAEYLERANFRERVKVCL